MAIIFKFIIKSIREKKFRTFLILLAITLSTALFFASNALSLTLQKMFLGVMKKYYGSSNIIIRTTEKSDWYIYTYKAEKFQDRLDYVIGSTEGSGTYKPNRNESINFYLRGFDLDELALFNQPDWVEKGDILPFTGTKMIVSQMDAKQYNWKLGDTVDLDMRGVKRRFRIEGIAAPTGLFQAGFDKQITVVIPREYLASLYNKRGKATIVYIKAKNEKEIPSLISNISMEYPRYRVQEPIDKAEQEQFSSGIKTPLLLMTILVLFMSVFIIFSSFKVITIERLPIIGTFRSIGATRKTTDFVLIVESLLYGITGGLAGCVLGIGILYLMTYLMSYNAWSGFRMKTEIVFTVFHMITAFVLAVVLSLVSSIIPIVKVSKIPVKDIVLNKIETAVKAGHWKIIAGFGALAVSLIAPQLTPKKLGFPVAAGSMFLEVVSIIILIPFLTKWFVKLFERVYHFLIGNEGVLAAKNLRENKNILNNISLLAISISSILMIFTVSFSAIKDIVSFYKDARFQVWMWVWQADRNFEMVLRATKGVEDTYAVYSAQNTEIEENKKRINLIHGINTRKYLEFWDLKIPGDLMEKLDEGRYILLTEVLRKKLDAKAGDVYNLKLKNGKKPYEVIGFFNSFRWGGNYALVSEKYLKSDAGLQYYDDIYVKTTGPPADVENTIKTKMVRRYPWVNTVAQMQDNELKSNQQFMTLLEGFAVMTLVIGIFGVLNNYIISFVERRRFLAIFRSVGMSKKQIVRMMLMESLTGGLISGIVGCIGGGCMIFIVVYLMRSMDMYVDMHLSPVIFAECLLASVFISLVASISPALKSGKLNIIEAIKYE